MIRRLLQGVLIVWAAASLAFGLAFLSGDPATLMIDDHWTDEQVVKFREYMGYDRPFHVQYLEFLGRLLHGDFGVSVRQHLPVSMLILERFPATLELTAAGLLIIVGISIPVGILSAVYRNSIWDALVMGATLLTQSMPVFWLGTILILIVGVRLRWLPLSGRDGLAHLILPALTLGSYSTARNARVMRSSMLDVLGDDYVRTARSKGLSEAVVIFRHALKNALIPVVTMLGLEMGSLLSGAVITETVFAWPGVGRLLVQAIYARDYPLVQGAITFIALIFVVVNLLVDLSYAFLNPRIRYD
jgi:peptide/nickel transport system permease protein